MYSEEEAGSSGEEEEDSDDADEDGEEGGTRGQKGASTTGRGQQGGQPHASFMAGEKGDSFARAFAKIMTKKVKPAKAEEGSEAGAAAASGSAAGAAAILAQSSSLAKRRAEEEADLEAQREAKRKRLEMKKRGHLVSHSLVECTGVCAFTLLALGHQNGFDTYEIMYGCNYLHPLLSLTCLLPGTLLFWWSERSFS